MLDDHRALDPPDSIPNSEVKRRIADGSVGLPHVRVGHRQAFIKKKPELEIARVFLYVELALQETMTYGQETRPIPGARVFDPSA